MMTQYPDEASGDGAENRADQRLTSLGDRLKSARRAEGELTAHKEVGKSFTGKGASQGNRVLSVLLGSPLGGLIIGFALDRVLGTQPKIMLGLLFFGILAGFVQVLRISRERAD
jgi:ATP synthase protein I